MPPHSDAVGYLKDLAREVNEPWFYMICDQAIVNGSSHLDNETLLALAEVYVKAETYVGNGVAASIPPTAQVSAPADFLEVLSEFNNFKRLGNTLQVEFDRQVTLVFGTNGSGKSSLCESLRILANPEAPVRPLRNLREPSSADPEFRFKFRSDSTEQAWTASGGFGRRANTVKYFDAAVAIKNVVAAIEPGSVVELTPFKLNTVEWIKSMVIQLRDILLRLQAQNSELLSLALATIRADFQRFTNSPLASIDERKVRCLPSEIELGEKFGGHELLNEKRLALKELERAATDEGVRLLRAEHRELESFTKSLKSFIASASDFWALEPAKRMKELSEKQGAQRQLAGLLIPAGGTIDGLLSLLRAASSLCRLEEPLGHACPLCKRSLGMTEVGLFKAYHGLLEGELEKGIRRLKDEASRASNLLSIINDFDMSQWDRFTSLTPSVVTGAKMAIELIRGNCGLLVEATPEAHVAMESLNAIVENTELEAESKRNAVGVATIGKQQVDKEVSRLRAEIEPLDYGLTVSEKLVKLKEALSHGNHAEFWALKIPAFTPLLKRITTTAKLAYEDLVVADFEDRLNAEYKALTEKDMTLFGVKLARKGTDASVTVIPQIGGKDIDSVLSEGEQRVHALALFLAELETCSQSVLVFDDPISSFDYNHVGNFCIRLRDFALKHPATQIIVLTHNWEFFVHLQSTLNKAQLTHRLSVQILENCVSVSEYREKIAELKQQIEAELNVPGEPTSVKKEEVAGNMRRLIEAVVNAHVFNHQRRQYKQRSLPVSEFSHFTKIVPLLDSEAIALRDLYEKLSITEHDDPRSAYVNTDRAIFLSRYNKILAIEDAVVARKP